MKREDLPKGMRGTAVEVGTHQGIYADAIATHFRGEVYLVDPYDGPDIVYHPRDKKTKTRAEDFRVAQRRLSRHGGRARFMRKPSDEAAVLFEDATLDFVYIDALHDTENIVRDFACWYPKVRLGGMLAGHDYDDECHTEVREAVDCLAKLYGETVHTTDDRWPSWFIYKGEQ